jgi:hypothetical protein
MIAAYVVDLVSTVAEFAGGPALWVLQNWREEAVRPLLVGARILV